MLSAASFWFLFLTRRYLSRKLMRSFHIGHEKEFSKNDVIIKRSFTSCGGPQLKSTIEY